MKLNLVIKNNLYNLSFIFKIKLLLYLSINKT